MEVPQPVGALRRLDVRRVGGGLERLEKAFDVLADQPLVLGIAQQRRCVGRAGACCRRRDRRERRVSRREPFGEAASEEHVRVGEALLDRVPDDTTVIARQLDAAPGLERGIDAEAAS